MADIRTFAVSDDTEQMVAALRTDGAAIVTDVLAPDDLSALNEGLQPWVDATQNGRDDFTGRLTSRTGALVARVPESRDVVMHPLILDLAHAFLAPYTNKIQLHLNQVINIKPGSQNQPLHRDRDAWGGYIPAAIEPQFNTMWALTDFTESNGATRLVPGSPGWAEDRRATDDEKTQAAMSAGSVLLYSGSVVHGGGANQSTDARQGLNITYTLGWLRTEENQYLSCPPEIAKDLDPGLQELLGYTMGNYALGYYSDPVELPTGTDILAPEFALGRGPRKRIVQETLS